MFRSATILYRLPEKYGEYVTKRKKTNVYERAQPAGVEGKPRAAHVLRWLRTCSKIYENWGRKNKGKYEHEELADNHFSARQISKRFQIRFFSRKKAVECLDFIVRHKTSS